MVNGSSNLVRSYLDLPRDAKIDQFIVRDTSDAVELAKQYTLTSAIRPKLEGLLNDVNESLARNCDLGRFVFGSFGSGKSHFLRIVSMMLAGDQRLYQHARDASIRSVHGANAWLDSANILAIHTTMMGVSEAPDAFIRHLAGEFDRTLEGLGKPPLHAFGTKAVFDQFDALCAAAPANFDAFEARTGYGRTMYERFRSTAEGDPERTAFARELAMFVAGSESAFMPTDGEARKQMAAHAKGLGYSSIAFTIDEFVLWAQGISGGNYAAAVNALNALVESADVRAVPFIVLAAVQRNIMSVFPDDHTESMLREHLSHVKARFPEIVLEDSNLFEIAERRVLMPRSECEAEWRELLARVTRPFADAKTGVLIGDQPATTLAQLYPFHPALLRVLSDVTQGLQRDRSSLYMLYQLLTTVRPELKVGELVSLGALWEVLFSKDQVSGLEAYVVRSDTANAANRLLKTFSTWQRLRESIARESGGGDQERVLDLIVKSVLLMQLSHTEFLDEHRSLDQATTVENLFRLNRNDVNVQIETTGIMKIVDLVKRLAAAEPGTVVVRSDGAAAVVQIELKTVDLSSLMEGLHATASDRFQSILDAARDALGLSSVATTGQEGRFRVTWRSTEWSGRVRFESYEQFALTGRGSTVAMEPNEQFRIAIALESNLSGSGQEAIDNLRAKIESAREQTQSWVAVWIPAPLSTEGRAALETLAKVEVFRRDQSVHLAGYKAADHPFVRQRIQVMESQARTTLIAALRKAYGDDSRVITTRRDPGELFPPANVDLAQRARGFASALLDRRFGQYPGFQLAPNPVPLNRLLAIYRDLLDYPTRNAFSGQDAELIAKLGEPLELFEPGFGVTNIRSTGLYMTKLKEKFDQGERSVQKLVAFCGEEPWGLATQVAQLLIALLVAREGLRLLIDGASVQIVTVGDVSPKGTLAKGHLPTLAEWNAARNVASMLLYVSDIPQSHTVANADALAVAVKVPLDDLIGRLRRCVAAYDSLRKFGALSGESATELRYMGTWKAMLTLKDDAKVISLLAGLDLDSYLNTTRSAVEDADALEGLADFRNLEGVLNGSDDLRVWLERVLTDDIESVAPVVGAWRAAAEKWINDQLSKRGSPPPPPGPPEPEDRAESRLIQFTGNVDQVLADVHTIISKFLATNGTNDVRIEVEIRMSRAGDDASS